MDYGRCAVGCAYAKGAIAGAQRHSTPLTPLLQVSHGAIQFAAYEELKSLMLSRRARPAPSLALSGSGPPGVGRAGGAALSQSTDQLSTFEVTICGSLSKLVASVSTYPSQVRR